MLPTGSRLLRLTRGSARHKTGQWMLGVRWPARGPITASRFRLLQRDRIAYRAWAGNRFRQLHQRNWHGRTFFPAQALLQHPAVYVSLAAQFARFRHLELIVSDLQYQVIGQRVARFEDQLVDVAAELPAGIWH